MDPMTQAGAVPLNEQAASDPRTPPRSTSTPKDWIGKIEKRWKSLKKDWRDNADKAVKIYEAHDPSKDPFNILYSNTEVILPALYNSTPRPDVAARYASMQPTERLLDSAVSKAVERACEYFADTDQGDYETYGEAIECAVTNMLVPGLGQARVRYKVDENYQAICFESVAYDRFVWSYARTWRHVTWVAFGHDLEQVEFEEQFPEFAKTPKYKDFDWNSIENEETRSDSEDSPQAKGRALLVWEVWDWASKNVMFVCDRWQESFLLEQSYPAGLSSRFPCPRPLIFAKKVKELLPITPYRLYQQQAEQLNEISRRIKRVTSAIRARGIYNSVFGELQTLLNEDDDNILVPSEGAAAFEGGLDRQVWFMPVDMLVKTLRELYTARQEAKQSIYEIMGISDIIRGASNPNETAAAQGIKDKWGSLRVKKSQKQVQVFCLELFRIATELSAEYFTPATWKQITRLPYLFQSQKQQLQMQASLLQRQGEALQGQLAQVAPAAQQGDPQAQQMAQQLQMQLQQLQQNAPPPEMMKLLQGPAWEDIIQVLKGTFERSYRIDIETNSTVDLEATEDKQAIGEFMNAFGQMTAGLAPMVESGALPFEASKEIMAETFRRFRFGRKVSEALEQMKMPEQKADPKEIEKQVSQKAELEKTALNAQHATQVAKLETRVAELELQLQGKDVEGRSREFDGKVRQNELQRNYEGKLQQQKQHLAAKDAQLTEEKLQGIVQQITGQIAAVQQEMAANEQMRAEREKMQQQQPAESEQLVQQIGQALIQLSQGQEAILSAIAQVAELASADREAEIYIGQDGKKRSRSRLIRG